jgi:hypothetical protein
MNVERHGHVVEMPTKARCGGPSVCAVCQREQDYEDGRRFACEVTQQYVRSYKTTMDISPIEGLLTSAFMAGRRSGRTQ